MRYVIPISACCIVGQYWIKGMAGVGVALIILSIFNWFGEIAEPEKEVEP